MTLGFALRKKKVWSAVRGCFARSGTSDLGRSGNVSQNRGCVNQFFLQNFSG